MRTCGVRKRPNLFRVGVATARHLVDLLPIKRLYRFGRVFPVSSRISCAARFASVSKSVEFVIGAPGQSFSAALRKATTEEPHQT